MTIYNVMSNLMKMQKFYQMNTEEEQETIRCAVGYLENLKVFAEKMDGVSADWKERAVGNDTKRFDRKVINKNYDYSKR